jgi:hypothetical protein
MNTDEALTREDICEIFGPMIASFLIDARSQTKRIARLEETLAGLRDAAKPAEVPSHDGAKEVPVD